MNFPRILIVDFGSQYTLLIAKEIRRLHVYSEIVQPQDLEEYLDQKGGLVHGIILSGGPHSVSSNSDPEQIPSHNDENLAIIEKCLNRNQIKPILGICYGAQALAKLAGAQVLTTAKGEYGYLHLNIEPNMANDALHQGISIYEVWQSHSDSIYLDPGNLYKNDQPKYQLDIISKHEEKIEAFRYTNRSVWGVQYHPEVTHCSVGTTIFTNFIEITHIQREWSATKFLDRMLPEINSKVPSPHEKVIVACSGGVDSTVLASLVQMALGSERMVGVFVDTGLLRLNEYQEVMEGYQRMGLNVVGLDAKERFMSALTGITEPEQKRKTVGRLFIEVLSEWIKTNSNSSTWLGQGTIYPDVIESQGGIKSHHNVGGLPEKLNLKLLEPLRYLFKDDVRDLGTLLKVDPVILGRHPFPGPGLSIRILGEISPEKVSILQRADHIYMNMLKKYGHYDQIWQAGAILLNSKSVGVQGDNRTYEWVLALRAVNSVNGMTASVYPLPTEFLTLVSTEIINQVRQINRVTYDVTTKPPGTIEWE
jgi:GMP synthase (glutamine-hydrolysing)